MNEKNIYKKYHTLKIEKKKKLGLTLCFIVVIINIVILWNTLHTIAPQSETYTLLTSLKQQFNTSLLNESIIIISIHVIALIILLLSIYNLSGKKYSILFVLGISPFLINISSSLTYQLLGITTIFITALSMKYKNYIGVFFAYAATLFFSVYLGIIIFATIIYKIFKGKISIWYGIIFTLPLFMIPYLTVPKQLFIQDSMLRVILTDFGAMAGISIIIAILGLIGFITIWKKEPFVTFNVVVAIIISFFHIPSGIILLNIIALYTTSGLLFKIMENKWHLQDVKFLTVILIICSIIFSSIVAVTILIDNHKEMSTNTFQEAEEWMKQNIKENEVVLTHYNYGERLTYTTGKTNSYR